MSHGLFTWTIFQNTSDFPNKIVGRKFDLDKPTNEFFTSDDIHVVRKWIQQEAERFGQPAPECIPRNVNDDIVIVETWI